MEFNKNKENRGQFSTYTSFAEAWASFKCVAEWNRQLACFALDYTISNVRKKRMLRVCKPTGLHYMTLVPVTGTRFQLQSAYQKDVQHK